ncbi:S8 family serine peptidase [Polycladidibacter stylochi]|uniref:S8 family serine peptidase n=1 Tax=Polycladidibacter stylochi TaxID=1807766 RepID=UPI00082B10D3|nr:S8 family serine peptidase [Pseudovibrio stylochi]
MKLKNQFIQLLIISLFLASCGGGGSGGNSGTAGSGGTAGGGTTSPGPVGGGSTGGGTTSPGPAGGGSTSGGTTSPGSVGGGSTGGGTTSAGPTGGGSTSSGTTSPGSGGGGTASGGTTSGGTGVITPLLRAHDGTSSYISVDSVSASALNAITSDNEFLKVDDGRPYSHSFIQENIHYAHALGLTGKGKKIAILDPGFKEDHQELAGKSEVKGKNSPESHGTSVAAIAAGKKDGKGMLGAAYDAELILLSSKNKLTDRVQFAIDSGAVAQNNSWGWVKAVDGKEGYYDELLAKTNSGLTSGEAYASLINFSDPNPNKTALKFAAINIESYITKLREFSKQGVIIYAHSNDENLRGADLNTSLPLFFDGIEDSFIAVVNASPTNSKVTWVDNPDGSKTGYRDSRVIDANTTLRRHSSKCWQTARYCITGNGNVVTANWDPKKPTVLNNYAGTGGTSHTAPQIAGIVAIMAQAFPTLRPEEWVDRILASANNRFKNFVKLDSVDFGNGVSHAYSEEFGHGFVDVKAALLPIGNVGLVRSEIARGDRLAIEKASIQTSGGQMNALISQLRGQKMAVFDALGTDFYVDAIALLAEKQGKPLGDKLGSFMQSAKTKQSTPRFNSFAFATALPGTQGSNWQYGAGDAQDIAMAFGFSQERSVLSDAPQSILALAENGIGFGASTKLENGRFASFALSDASVAGHETLALGFARSFDLDESNSLFSGASFSFSGSAVHERGDFLGLTQATDSPFTSTSGTFGGAFNLPIGSLQFNASAQISSVYGRGNSFLTPHGASVASAYALSLSGNDVLFAGDRLSLSFTQPLYIEKGQATFKMAVGRTKEGKVLFKDKDLSLRAEARQFDFGLNYQADLTDATLVKFGATLSLNESYVSGATGGGAMATLVHRF